MRINDTIIKDFIHKPWAARYVNRGNLFVKVNMQNANHARAAAPILACCRYFIETIEIVSDKSSSTLAKLETTTPDYMPNILTTELWE